MVSQLHSHHDSSTTTSAHSLIFSFDSLASVSSYPPLSLHATAAVPATPGTAPTVPSLDASRPLTMAESLKSGQGSSLTPAAPSVLDPPASDTTLPSSSNTYFSPKYSLRSTCGADLQCLNNFKATLALLQTIGDFPRLDHSTDKSITITVSSASQGVLLRKMTSLLCDHITVDLHPSCQHSQRMITSPILYHMTTADILEGMSLQGVAPLPRCLLPLFSQDTDGIFPASFRPQTSGLAAILRTVQVMERRKPAPGDSTPSGPSPSCAMHCSSDVYTRKRSRSPQCPCLRCLTSQMAFVLANRWSKQAPLHQELHFCVGHIMSSK